VTALLLFAGLVLSTGASGAGTANGVVVPPNGKLAGLTYAQWLQIAWQIAFSGPPSGPPVCAVRNTGHGPVELLQAEAPGRHAYTCSLPAGRPTYVVGVSNECSTVEAPPSHANTPAQLKACARKNEMGAVASASIDGRPVRNYRSLSSRTPTFRFHLPADNILGTKTRTGLAAAYGEGLLLRGLSAGARRVHVTGAIPGFTTSVTYTLHVH
jgi:hypothetical protein